MKKLLKKIQKKYNFVNKQTKIPQKNWITKPLFSSKIFSEIQKHDFKKIQNQDTEKQIKIIQEDPILLEQYVKISPFSIYSSLSSIKLRYVIASNFIENLNTLELHIMDVDGFYTYYLELENLVPLTYRDLNEKFLVNIPYMDFINQELVFTNMENEYFVFNGEGEWVPETANLEALDFRNLYNEDKWIDRDLCDN